MTCLRILCVSVVSVLCFLDARGVKGGVITNQNENAIATLETVLNEAVKESVLPKAEAKRLLAGVCAKESLQKDTSGEILKEALDIGWRNFDISSGNIHKLSVWASKDYPEIFPPMEYLSVSEIIEWLKTDLPSIESQLTQLSGNKLKAVQIAATVLEEAYNERRVTKKSAPQIVEEFIEWTSDYDTPGEILREVLDMGWENIDISSPSFNKLSVWASKDYPEIFPPVEYLSVSEIMEWLKTDRTSIESQLSQLSGDKLKAVQIAATVLKEGYNERGVSKKTAAQIVEEIIKSTSDDDNNAMAPLNKVLPESVSQKLIPEMVRWTILRVAMNANLDKKDDN